MFVKDSKLYTNLTAVFWEELFLLQKDWVNLEKRSSLLLKGLSKILQNFSVAKKH